MFDSYPPKSVVVGVDGSQAAIRAARWAVDEVAGTDTPLRLLYVTKANPSAGRLQARAALATAEEVVHDAYGAVEAMGKPVKVEMEIINGDPVAELIAASRSTSMLCVGDTGSAQHPAAWLGSTAKELARSAHCSVAIVRGDHRDKDTTDGGWVVARVDESADDIDVLDLAINEARRRRARLQVVTSPQPRSGDSEKDRGADADDRRARVPLVPHLVRWIEKDYPEVEADTIALEGRFLDYLAEHAASIQLVMVGATRTGEVQQLLGPAGALALRHSDFSLLIVGLERPGP